MGGKNSIRLLSSTARTRQGKEAILGGRPEGKWLVRSKMWPSRCQCPAWRSLTTQTLQSRPSSATTSSWLRARSECQDFLPLDFLYPPPFSALSFALCLFHIEAVSE